MQHQYYFITITCFVIIISDFLNVQFFPYENCILENLKVIALMIAIKSNLMFIYTKNNVQLFKLNSNASLSVLCLERRGDKFLKNIFFYYTYKHIVEVNHTILVV